MMRNAHLQFLQKRKVYARVFGGPLSIVDDPKHFVKQGLFDLSKIVRHGHHARILSSLRKADSDTYDRACPSPSTKLGERSGRLPI